MELEREIKDKSRNIVFCFLVNFRCAAFAQQAANDWLNKSIGLGLLEKRMLKRLWRLKTSKCTHYINEFQSLKESRSLVQP
jgi:hypothetical protein